MPSHEQLLTASEPYIPDEEATPQEIPVKFDYIDESCYLNVFSNVYHIKNSKY